MPKTNLKSLLLLAAVSSAFLSACGGGGAAPNSTERLGSLPEISMSAGGTQQLPNAAVDSYVQGMLKGAQIPGLSLAVMENGKLIYAKSYGYANLESATPATPEHRFQIGSITKSFVAIGVLLLVEEGKVSLDATISTYLGPVPPTWAKITVRQLLNHTSGMQREPDASMVRLMMDRQVVSDAEFLAAAMAMPLESAPGAGFSYSNVAYNVLGVLIGKVSGKSYGDFLRERVFGPLDMRNTRVMKRDDSLASSVTGYEKAGAAIKPHVESLGLRHLFTLAAGGIESTALDMAKYDAALHTGVLPSRSSQTEMWTKSVLVQAASSPDDSDIHYGLGWLLSQVNGHRKVYHSGATTAQIAEFIRYPEAGISVVVLTNQGYASLEPQLVARKVAQMFRPGLPYCCDPG